MLEKHPLSAVHKWLLYTFTTTLCWRTTPCQPSANVCLLNIFIAILCWKNPLSAICKWVLYTLTAILCWKSTPCQPSTNDYYIHSQLLYAGEPPLVSHLQMSIKYIHSYIMLENHPLSVICICLLTTFTAMLCWRTTPHRLSANDY
jgi:hypothetical protein